VPLVTGVPSGSATLRRNRLAYIVVPTVAAPNPVLIRAELRDALLVGEPAAIRERQDRPADREGADRRELDAGRNAANRSSRGQTPPTVSRP
jgi:hypothetical protein